MSLEFVSYLLDLLLLWLDWNVKCEITAFLLLPGACWWKCRAAGRTSDCHVLWQTQHAYECAEWKVGIRPLWLQELHWDKRRNSSVLPGSKCCLRNNCSYFFYSFKSVSATMCRRAQSVGNLPSFAPLPSCPFWRGSLQQVFKQLQELVAEGVTGTVGKFSLSSTLGG